MDGSGREGGGVADIHIYIIYVYLDQTSRYRLRCAAWPCPARVHEEEARVNDGDSSSTLSITSSDPTVQVEERLSFKLCIYIHNLYTYLYVTYIYTNIIYIQITCIYSGQDEEARVNDGDASSILSIDDAGMSSDPGIQSKGRLGLKLYIYIHDLYV